ncbi:hypothetical protein GCM10010245_84600 [Streptomyces spectabilis]|nr:hypothetical protein GCM10010245_84600 [Streptomyces spectabilis]
MATTGALPQRQQCGDARRDDRILLDTGQDCPRCEDRQAHRRAQRHAVAAAVDAAMPGASEAERRAAADRQLHQNVTAQAWIREHRWAQVREQQAAAAQARAEAAAAQLAFEVPAAPTAPVVLPRRTRRLSSPLRNRGPPTATSIRRWSSRT